MILSDSLEPLTLSQVLPRKANSDKDFSLGVPRATAGGWLGSLA